MKIYTTPLNNISQVQQDSLEVDQVQGKLLKLHTLVGWTWLISSLILMIFLLKKLIKSLLLRAAAQQFGCDFLSAWLQHWKGNAGYFYNLLLTNCFSIAEEFFIYLFTVKTIFPHAGETPIPFHFTLSFFQHADVPIRIRGLQTFITCVQHWVWSTQWSLYTFRIMLKLIFKL